MIKRIALIIIAIIVQPAMGQSIEFEFWSLGKTRKEIIKKAKRSDVELEKNKVIYRGSTGLPLNEMNYQKNVLGEEAEINLMFTKKTNILFAVSVIWRNLANKSVGKRIYELVDKVLHEKYLAESHEKTDGYTVQKDVLYKDCTVLTKRYKKDNLYLLRFRCDGRIFISINHVNEALKLKNLQEMELTKQKMNVLNYRTGTSPP